MQVLPANEFTGEIDLAEITDLFFSSGPTTYSYQFNGRKNFDRAMTWAWTHPQTAYARDVTSLAVEDGKVLGLETGFAGPEFDKRVKGLRTLWPELLETGEITQEALAELGRRTRYARWLNPPVRADYYYILALAVKEECRGKKVGVALIESVMERARSAGFKGVSLDVLSSHAAVGFYKSLGFECVLESRAPALSDYGVPVEYHMQMRL